jgi:hypothetical protein
MCRDEGARGRKASLIQCDRCQLSDRCVPTAEESCVLSGREREKKNVNSMPEFETVSLTKTLLSRLISGV